MGMPGTMDYTVADLADMPEDGQRYELIRGELVVSPAPSVRHAMVVRRLDLALTPYLDSLGLADTLVAVQADISWDDRNLVQPDLLVFRPEEISASWATIRRLRLAIEVISPSSRHRDRYDKRTLYQENQVETYWIVDPDTETVECWHPEDEAPDVVREYLRWRVFPEAPEVVIDLARLFIGLP